LLRLRKSIRTDQRDKADAFQLCDHALTVLFAEEEKFLHFGRADRDDEAAVIGELIEEAMGDIRRGSGDDDAIEGSAIGKAVGSITMDSSDIGIAELRENVLRRDEEGRYTLDGEDFMRKFAEECGLVSGAGADFKDTMVGGDFERLQHVGDDVRLGDGLPFADGDRIVVVGSVVKMRWDKLVAWDFLHRGKDALVVDAATAELRRDHGATIEYEGI